jgi:NAD(P)H-dependent FMN reductase
MPRLGVLIASTRPGRAGLPIATWFTERAREHGKFDVTLIDLKEVNLPFMDEPKHPRFRQYEHAHTKAWSATIEACDAFVFVTPEYNYSSPPALVNAIDYLAQEWAYKPAAFVAYGGMAGGARSVQMTKLLLTAVKMMPIPDGVSIPFFQKLMNENKEFSGNEDLAKAARGMLDELLRWTNALMTLRASP